MQSLATLKLGSLAGKDTWGASDPNYFHRHLYLGIVGPKNVASGGQFKLTGSGASDSYAELPPKDDPEGPCAKQRGA